MRVRIVLATLALAVLLIANYPIAIGFAVPVVGAIGYWLVVRRPKLDVHPSAVTEIDTDRVAASIASELGNLT